MLGATGMANNAHHVVTGAAGVNDATRPVLDGFAISGGHAADNGGGMYNNNLGNFGPRLSNLEFRYNRVVSPGTGTGGALYNNLSNLLVNKVTFLQNLAPNGGAVHDEGGSSTYTQIEFSENRAIGVQGLNDVSLGAALYSTNSNTSSFERVFFYQNDSTGSGGGAAIVNASPRFTNAVFNGNHGTIYGGALYIFGNSGPQLIHATLYGNSSSGGSTDGGKIYQEPGTTPGLGMVNSLLAANETLNGYTVPSNQGNVTGFNPGQFTQQFFPKGCDQIAFTADDGYRLRTTATTALDMGVMGLSGFTLPGTDILGVTRPSGAAPDPGAYEGGFAAGCLPPV